VWQQNAISLHGMAFYIGTPDLDFGYSERLALDKGQQKTGSELAIPRFEFPGLGL